MAAPHNPFKAALAAGKPQIGLWLALTSAYSAEILGQTGFDWLLVDGEHAPNDIPTMVSQLQALGRSPAHPVVRVPVGEAWLIKQVLDIGAQTVMVPMVETAAQAAMLARAMRYPPAGIRGVGASLARASSFGGHADYVTTANAEVCLLVQVESQAGLAELDAIAATDGVDGVFLGPADLAADMGHPGHSDAPEVLAAIDDAIARIRKSGKAPGILTGDHDRARHYLALGATLVAVGNDVALLRNGARALRAAFD